MLGGLGIDVLAIARVERALRRDADGFERDVFTAGELAAADDGPRRARWLALRFAAKEAVAKALGLDGGLGTSWAWIEILPDGGGGPGVALHGPLAVLAARRGIRRVHLSLAHTRSLAAASAAVELGAVPSVPEVSP
jgi:holo-[acyl-carrier protein] synthase